MRKIVAAVVSAIMVFLCAPAFFAQAATVSSKTNQSLSPLSGVKCISENLLDKVEISVSSYKGYIVKRFDKPDRIVIDIPNTSVTGNMKTINVKSKMIKAVRYSQFDKTTGRVVIDTIGQPQYDVEEKTGKIILYIANPILKGVTYYKDGDRANLILAGIRLLDGKSGTTKLFTEKYELSGKKYTITFSSSLAKIENKTVKINDGFINTIEVVNDKATKKTSISFSTRSKYAFDIAAKEDVKGTAIRITNPELADRGYENRGSEEGTDSEEFIPDVSSPEENQPDKEEIPDLPDSGGNGAAGPLLEIKWSNVTKGKDQIVIPLEKYENYNIMRLTGPDRIVVDVPDVSVTGNQQTITVGSSLVKNIRYAQYENKMARVVIDTVGQPQYQVEEKAGQLVLLVESPTYKNFIYNSNGDRIFFTLNKAKLTEAEATQKKLFTESLDESGLRYTITFKSTQADIGTGTFKVNDSFLTTVDIIKDQEAGTTSVTFNAKEKILYNVVTRKLTNDAAITLMKPFAPEDKVVVIDAGHGGIDPGATSGDLKEKNLNLDIAIRLNSLLKSKGVKTYMTREEDCYVGLYERAFLANAMNGDLFLSIHNNAYYASHKGTEVLYHSAGGFGQKFAQMLQNVLLKTLNTNDRKIKARPELVVLKATTMPAALAEIAFLTNSEDKAKLMDENFRQKAAQALCDGVLEALKAMEP